MAHAGNDQTVNEGATDIQLNGSATDPDTDDTITYLWSQTQGPTVTLSSSTSVSPTFDAPLINSDQAILTFSLTVNDGAADSTPDTVDITVSNVNTPPTANAGADQTVDEGTADIQLNGSGSTDPDGDTITYLWSQTQGPTVTLSSSTSVSPTFDAPLINSDQAILTFSLTVNDGAVDSANNDTVIVTILDTDSSDVTNQAPTANAGDPQVVGEGKTVILDGSASTDDKGSGNLRYEWRQDLTDSIQVTLLPETDNPAIVTFDAPADVNSPQILTFILKVIDKEDLSNDARVTVTILDTDAVTPSPGGGSSGGGGGGGGGGGPIRIDNVYIKSVSWDCNAGTIKIIAGPDSDYLSISVRTTQLGAHQASVAGDDIPGYRAFVSNMDKTEDYIGIKAVAPHSRDPATISESINITECTGERIFDEYMQPESTLPSAVTQTEEEVAATQRTEDTPVTEGQKTIFDSPLHQQLKGNIPAEMVQCNEGLVLILKPNMEESACVRESTAHKLVMRGWHGII